MQGFIKERTPGRFTVYWKTRDPSTGQFKQHTRGGFTRREPARPPQGDSAREFLNSIIGSVQSGTWKPDHALTIKSLLEEHWLPAQQSRNLKPTTLSQYENVIKAWIVPNVGAMKVPALTPKDVQVLVETLRTKESSQGRKGLAPRSLQLTVGTLKAAYAFAVETGLLGRNPISGVRRPSVEDRAPTAWDEEVSRLFLKVTNDDRLSALWALALTRGLRRGELAGLRWSAIDLSAGSLRVVSTRVMVDGHPQESTPKTKSGARTVPLDDHLVALLRTHQATQGTERLGLGLGRDRDGYVFTNTAGEPLSPDWISRRFDELVKDAELPRISLHGTRHTAATLMLAAGVQPKVVQEMLGHSHVSITLGIYGHVTPTMGAEAGAALSASLFG